jgi:hypothetical protein
MSIRPSKEKSFKGKGDKYPESGKTGGGTTRKWPEGDKYPDDEVGWEGPEGDPIPLKDPEIEIPKTTKRIKYGDKSEKGVKTGR